MGWRPLKLDSMGGSLDAQELQVVRYVPFLEHVLGVHNLLFFTGKCMVCHYSVGLG